MGTTGCLLLLLLLSLLLGELGNDGSELFGGE
jgi:hypothetical protein